jgi:hypothetical protein
MEVEVAIVAGQPAIQLALHTAQELQAMVEHPLTVLLRTVHHLHMGHRHTADTKHFAGYGCICLLRQSSSLALSSSALNFVNYHTLTKWFIFVCCSSYN